MRARDWAVVLFALGVGVSLAHARTEQQARASSVKLESVLQQPIFSGVLEQSGSGSSGGSKPGGSGGSGSGGSGSGGSGGGKSGSGSGSGGSGSGGKSGGEKPGENKPGEKPEKPSKPGEKPDKPGDGKSGGDKPSDKPGGEKPSEKPGGEKPSEKPGSGNSGSGSGGSGSGGKGNSGSGGSSGGNSGSGSGNSGSGGSSGSPPPPPASNTVPENRSFYGQVTISDGRSIVCATTRIKSDSPWARLAVNGMWLEAEGQWQNNIFVAKSMQIVTPKQWAYYRGPGVLVDAPGKGRYELWYTLEGGKLNILEQRPVLEEDVEVIAFSTGNGLQAVPEKLSLPNVDLKGWVRLKGVRQGTTGVRWTEVRSFP